MSSQPAVDPEDYLLAGSRSSEKVLLDQARALSKQGKHQESLDMLLAALQKQEEPDSDEIFAQWLFHVGVCYGNLGNHEEAKRIADRLLAKLPERSEGYYLAGMQVAADGGHAEEAKELFLRGRALDPRGGESIASTNARLDAILLRRKHQRYRDNIRKFGELVNALSAPTCKSCGHTFSSPTPEWFCSKCWPESHVRVWESDDGGVCRLCDKALGALSRHHCRSCGKLCCNDCSSETMAVPLLNFKTPVRVCDKCGPILKKRAERARGRSPSPNGGAGRQTKRSPSAGRYSDVFVPPTATESINSAPQAEPQQERPQQGSGRTRVAAES